MSAPVYAILSADAGVTALVGTRIYPYGIIPQEVTTFPVIVYQTISGTTENVLLGTSSADQERVQIDCWGDASAGAPGAQADAVYSAVRAALEGAAPAAHGCSVQLENENGHDYEQETKRIRNNSDWMFTTLR
jgi:hypothetical protein